MQYVVKAQNLDGLDDFTHAYLEAAEWCGMDDEGDAALELAVDPTWDAPSIAQAKADCSAFQTDNAALLAGIDRGQAGHDFWLTRNGHGAGFWDRGLGKLGDKLTDAAHVYGETGVTFDADTETLTLDGVGTYTDLAAGAGDTVIHVPEDPDGIVLQEGERWAMDTATGNITRERSDAKVREALRVLYNAAGDLPERQAQALYETIDGVRFDLGLSDDDLS